MPAHFFDLSGQVAVVTGAAQGIGEAIARRLAEAGATVIIADKNGRAGENTAASIAHQTGQTVISHTLDVADQRQVEDVFSRIIQEFGHLEILVNNAGIAGPVKPVWELDLLELEEVIRVNLIGTFLCSKAVISHMRQRRYGRIVNISSIAGKEGNPNMSAYSASKAAVIALTKAMAKEVATEGICVNCVTPAVVRTPILDGISEDQIRYMVSRIPMGRTGEPEEIAAVVHFLSSRECSFVTGQCYDVSGGRATY